MKNLKSSTAALLALLILATGCTGFKRPWRDYSKRPFDAQAWREGDKIERGRMAGDFKGLRPALQGHSRETIAEMLGEPDLKKTIEGREVWLYRVDIGIPGGMDLMPVSFDPNKGSMFGMVRGSTLSAMVKEEDL